MPNYCRNGPTCYYLRNSRCHFYHPPSHTNPTTSRSTMFSPPRSTTFLSTTQTRSTFQASLYQSIMKRLLQARSLRGQQEKKVEEAPLPTLVLKGKKVETVRIKTEITDSQKSAHFEKCQHFYFYEGCPHEECAICIENFAEDKKRTITRLCCEHAFHTDCLETWLKKNVTCPLCKRNFITKETEKEKKPELTSSNLFRSFLPPRQITHRNSYPFESEEEFNLEEEEEEEEEEDHDDYFHDYIDHEEDYNDYGADDFEDYLDF